MDKQRALSDEEVAECTGARTASAANHKFEVQLDGAWLEVDQASYERVRQIQDSCA